MIRAISFVALLSACGDNVMPSSDRYNATWSQPTVTDGTRVYALDCGDVSGHPCSLITHATTADIDLGGSDATVAWGGFVGVDANGNDLADRTFVDDATVGSAGELELAERGDDGGLRLAAALAPDVSGWSGDVAWMLGSVAGTTTFHLELHQ